MAASSTRVVLVSRGDRAWVGSFERAVGDRGIDTVEAHNCWSAAFVNELHDGEAVVMDANIVCGFVSADRPGPVLTLAKRLPVVIFNAEALDEQQRSAAIAHGAAMLDGDELEEIARCLENELPAS